MESCTPNENASNKPTIEEERLLAEIEYYKEKTAYYRAQKHLITLQAKKLQNEIEQKSY